MKLRDAKREAAAWALARNPVQAAAAKAAGVDPSSITRWLKDASFSGRVDELRMLAVTSTDDEDEASEAAERGLARLVPIAEAVVEAALKGEKYPDEKGHVPTPQQHNYALKTIELARKLEPKATGLTGTPSLGDLIAQADAARTRTR